MALDMRDSRDPREFTPIDTSVDRESRSADKKPDGLVAAVNESQRSHFENTRNALFELLNFLIEIGKSAFIPPGKPVRRKLRRFGREILFAEYRWTDLIGERSHGRGEKPK